MATILAVDDSASMRQMVSFTLKGAGYDVIEAVDGVDALNKAKGSNPDAVLTDVNMPNMDGITFLSNLMRLRPMPVVMVSTLTEAGAEITLDALELGAVDFINKPKTDFSNSIQDYASELIGKVKVASVAQLKAGAPKPKKKINSVQEMKVEKKHSADAILELNISKRNYKLTDSIIAIGASTGGTEAIREVLEEMPADSPGIVITQHIPEKFSASFAVRMDKLSAMKVCEATDGQQILAGHVYIAPGDKHMLVEKSGARYVCRLNDGPAVNRHKPSVNVLFRSVANQLGRNAIGVILTGMGDDGAEGLSEMKQAGAVTIAQDERTSVVWGMPGEAVKQNAVDDILPLNNIAKRLISLSASMAA